MPSDYSDRIEVWTTWLRHTDPVVVISGRRIVAGGKEYAIVTDKRGRISRGIDRAYVEEFPSRSQPAQALEREFQRLLESDRLLGEIADYEMDKAGEFERRVQAPSENYRIATGSTSTMGS